MSCYYWSYSSSFSIFTPLHHPPLSCHPSPLAVISSVSLFSHFITSEPVWAGPDRTPNSSKHLQAPAESLHAHGDLMLMAILETAGEPAARWMARGLSWRFLPQSRPCKENQACNTQLCGRVWALGGFGGSSTLMLFQLGSCCCTHYVFMGFCWGIFDLWNCGIKCHSGNSRSAQSLKVNESSTEESRCS